MHNLTEFIVKMTEFIAWPVAVVWLGYIFRNDVRSLLGRLSNLKWKDAEASFEKEIKDTEKKSKEIFKTPIRRNEKVSETEERLFRLADISPRAAILEAWTEIETEAYKYVSSAGKSSHRVSPIELIENLSSTHDFPKEKMGLLRDLRKIRNQATHLPDVSVTRQEAEKYIKIATQALTSINRFRA